MIIFGKERGFSFTVGASVEIAEMCPDGDLTKIEKFLSGKYGRVTRNGAKLIIELNKAYPQSAELYQRQQFRNTDRLYLTELSRHCQIDGFSSAARNDQAVRYRHGHL